MQIYGVENIPPAGPCLLTINHYSRPGFRAWWLALAVSAAMPGKVHWVSTAAWTFPDPLRKRLLTPLTRWLFRRLAEVYGFTTMPPMPPDPAEMADRAIAVRRVLNYARRTLQPIIGLAPEGADSPGSGLGMPPPGSGRFIHHLVSLGLPVTPVGAFEDDGRFCLRFGAAYELRMPAGLSPQERDRAASQTVMARIAALLPLTITQPENLHPKEPV